MSVWPTQEAKVVHQEIRGFEGIQPRFKAYCVAHGVNHAEGMYKLKPRGDQFMHWIRSRWFEWAKLHGKDLNHLTKQDHLDFDEWLFAQIGDI